MSIKFIMPMKGSSADLREFEKNDQVISWIIPRTSSKEVVAVNVKFIQQTESLFSPRSVTFGLIIVPASIQYCHFSKDGTYGP